MQYVQIYMQKFVDRYRGIGSDAATCGAICAIKRDGSGREKINALVSSSETCVSASTWARIHADRRTCSMQMEVLWIYAATFCMLMPEDCCYSHAIFYDTNAWRDGLHFTPRRTFRYRVTETLSSTCSCKPTDVPQEEKRQPQKLVSDYQDSKRLAKVFAQLETTFACST